MCITGATAIADFGQVTDSPLQKCGVEVTEELRTATSTARVRWFLDHRPAVSPFDLRPKRYSAPIDPPPSDAESFVVIPRNDHSAASAEVAATVAIRAAAIVG
jgi:hypothetical protein